MSFIQLPIMFVEDDYEKKEDLGLSPKSIKDIITINTQQICAYNEMENKNTLVRMANGDAYEVPLLLETFEELLSETEVIIDLTQLVSEN